jgi:phosphodiesterase/alkaline phosphatase D-like protein
MGVLALWRQAKVRTVAISSPTPTPNRSVTGITKTAASGPIEQLIFATVSCANW